ncbi:hypothetical protein [Thauera sp. Sel9]|uniref:hypothetical protein n=1 Tax=Thauera sp. Sel9 TaxID=2974299 RepID=UPI0021E13949|nr:hypothetical protein [Thauera sp. Sel9]MCV2216101.1 hypothetical protein [Thauera sp. Sel9]
MIHNNLAPHTPATGAQASGGFVMDHAYLGVPTAIVHRPSIAPVLTELQRELAYLVRQCGWSVLFFDRADRELIVIARGHRVVEVKIPRGTDYLVRSTIHGVLIRLNSEVGHE